MVPNYFVKNCLIAGAAFFCMAMMSTAVSAQENGVLPNTDLPNDVPLFEQGEKPDEPDKSLKSAEQKPKKLQPDKLPDNLDGLFASLGRETNEKKARKLAQSINGRWNESGSDTIDLLMAWAGEAMNDKQWGVAFDLLDQVIALAPQYAEGWNRRATAFFLRAEYGRSILDVEKVLALEPRHFGALSGMAGMLLKLGDEKGALIMWHKVLELYPSNKAAQNAVIRLEEKHAGQGT